MRDYINQIRQLAADNASIVEGILKNEIEKCYSGPYELEYRIKSEEGIIRKQKKFFDSYGGNIEEFPDILGFRISLPREEDCTQIASVLDKLSPHHLLDFFNQPKPTGFKAYLYYFLFSVNTDVSVMTPEVQVMTAEVQVMTFNMRDWTNETHYEHEIRKYGK